jgi:hypothetical protein
MEALFGAAFIGAAAAGASARAAGFVETAFIGGNYQSLGLFACRRQQRLYSVRDSFGMDQNHACSGEYSHANKPEASFLVDEQLGGRSDQR